MKPYYEKGGITIYHGDCREILPGLRLADVDLLLTDPPYFRVKDVEWDRQWKSPSDFCSWLGGCADDWRAVLGGRASLYVFASPDMAWHVEGELRKRFNVLNSIRWKKDAGWHNKADEESLRSYLSPWEAIIFAECQQDQYADAEKSLHLQVYAPIGRRVAAKRVSAGLSRGDVDIACSPSRKPTGLCYRWESGDCLPSLDQYVELCRVCGDLREYEELRREYEELRREYEELRREYEELRREYEELRRPFNLRYDLPRDDIWSFNAVQAYAGKHPCEKPAPLVASMVAASSDAGDLILDPFLGSGTTLVAAKALGRKAIGIEREERYCEIAAMRLAQDVLDFDTEAA